jgi:hypothetical protein
VDIDGLCRVVGVIGATTAFAACGATGPDNPGRSLSIAASPVSLAGTEPMGKGASAAGDALAALARVPLSFAPNAGQANGDVRYLARDRGTSLLFGDDNVRMIFSKPPDSRATTLARGLMLQLRFLRSDSTARLRAGPRDGGSVSHLVGDPSRWQGGLPTRSSLIYRGLWPGVDLVFRGRGGRLKYEFHVAPGSDVRSIRLAYAGARRLTIGPGGRLLIRTALGTLADDAPVSYQRHGAVRTRVRSRYTLRGTASAYGFALGSEYDPTRPLVIDPGIAYSTFLGGSGADEGMGIAVDQRGNAYVAGRTLSVDYPHTPGAFDPAIGGPSGSDAFVTKLDATGSRVLYSTYIGGGDTDEASAIAVDEDGNAFITGQTWSADYPVTLDAALASSSAAGDAFVSELGADGSQLVHSTLLGGSSRDAGLAIARAGGGVYVTGYTASSDFPTTPDGFDLAFGGATDIFMAEFAIASGRLAYSTFVGGTGADAGFGIAADEQGGVYVTGRTSSGDYPTTASAFDSNLDGSVDAVVTKLQVGGPVLTYSTLLGGAAFDAGAAIAVDRRGRAHVTGVTASGDYPTTAAAHDASFGGVTDAFVTVLGTDGSAPAYSTFLGGGNRDEGLGIALDEEQRSHVTGLTWSPDYPTTADAAGLALKGSADAFMTRLGAGGGPLVYSTFIGGTDYDAGRAIAVDESGRRIYLTGETLSADHPTTSAAFDPGANGGRDAFVTRVDLAEPRSRVDREQHEPDDD